MKPNPPEISIIYGEPNRPLLWSVSLDDYQAFWIKCPYLKRMQVRVITWRERMRIDTKSSRIFKKFVQLGHEWRPCLRVTNEMCKSLGVVAN